MFMAIGRFEENPRSVAVTIAVSTHLAIAARQGDVLRTDRHRRALPESRRWFAVALAPFRRHG